MGLLDRVTHVNKLVVSVRVKITLWVGIVAHVMMAISLSLLEVQRE